MIKLFFPQEDTVKRNMWFILSFILSFFPKENQDLFCRNATYQITQYTGKSESIPIRVADIFLTFFLSWILDQPCLCVAADGRAFALQTCDGVCCTHRTFCPPARTAERAGRGCSVGPVVSGHASPAPPWRLTLLSRGRWEVGGGRPPQGGVPLVNKIRSLLSPKHRSRIFPGN